MSLATLNPVNLCEEENQELPDFPEDDSLNSTQSKPLDVLLSLDFKLDDNFNWFKRFGEGAAKYEVVVYQMHRLTNYRILLYRHTPAAPKLAPRSSQTGLIRNEGQYKLCAASVVEEPEFFDLLTKYIARAKEGIAEPMAEAIVETQSADIPDADPSELLSLSAWETAALELGMKPTERGLGYLLHKPVGEHAERNMELIIGLARNKALICDAYISYPGYACEALYYGSVPANESDEHKAQVVRQLVANFNKVHELADGPLRNHPCQKIAWNPDVQHAMRQNVRLSTLKESADLPDFPEDGAVELNTPLPTWMYQAQLAGFRRYARRKDIAAKTIRVGRDRHKRIWTIECMLRAITVLNHVHYLSYTTYLHYTRPGEASCEHIDYGTSRAIKLAAFKNLSARLDSAKLCIKKHLKSVTESSLKSLNFLVSKLVEANLSSQEYHFDSVLESTDLPDFPEEDTLSLPSTDSLPPWIQMAKDAGFEVKTHEASGIVQVGLDVPLGTDRLGENWTYHVSLKNPNFRDELNVEVTQGLTCVDIYEPMGFSSTRLPNAYQFKAMYDDVQSLVADLRAYILRDDFPTSIASAFNHIRHDNHNKLSEILFFGTRI